MTTEERLAKVERELAETKAQAACAKRRTRWLLAALGLGLGVLALVWVSAASEPRAEAQGAAGGRTVRANKFVLEDENGKARAILTVDEDGPRLSLLDDAGKPRAALGVTADGPMLALLDANGKVRAGLAVVKGRSGLALYDEAEKKIWSAP